MEPDPIQNDKKKRSAGKSRKKEPGIPGKDYQRLMNDLQLQLVELEIQNEDLKKSKQELAALVHRYTLQYDLAPIGLFSISSEGLIIDLNNKGASLFEKERTDLLNHDFQLFLSLCSVDPFNKFLKDVFNGIERNGCEVDVSEEIVSSRSLLLEAKISIQDRICYLVAADITERKNAENTTREEKDLYQSVFKTYQVKSLLLDPESGEILNANPAAAEFYGYSLSKLKNMKFSDLIISSPNEINPLLNVSITGSKDYFVHRQRSADGQIRFVQTCLIPLKAEGPRRLLATFEDITDVRLAEEVSQERNFWEKEYFQKSGTGVFTLDFITDTWSCSEFIHELLEINNDYDHTINGFLSLIHPQQKAAVQYHLLSEVVARKQPFDKEFSVIRTSDRSEIWIRGRAELIFDNTGMLKKLSGTLQDITHQKKTEEYRNEAEKMYRLLMDASPDGIAFFAQDGTLTELSSGILDQMAVHKKEDLLGKHFFHFIPNSERKKVVSLIDKIISEDKPGCLECLILKPDKSTYIGEVGLVQIKQIFNDQKAFIASIRDVTARKKKEQQLIHLDRMAHLGEMATGMAHEINQPLNNISLALDNVFHEISLKDSLHDTYLQHKSKKIFDNILKIKNIIEHIREFARSDPNYAIQTLDINETIQNAVSILNTEFDERRIDLVLDLDYDIGSYSTDTLKLEQVLMNLLINAKDALEEKENQSPESFTKVIKIKTYQSGNMLCIEITDNGIGIRSAELDKVMNPFYTTKDPGKGTGLGLSISYGIISEMNGKIEVESKYGMGTTFRILLPVPDVSTVQ